MADAAGGGTGAGADKGGDPGGGAGADGRRAPVAYERFAEVVGERNDLRAKLGAAEAAGKAHEERAATADTLATQLRAEQAGRKADLASWQQKEALFGVGINDAEGQTVALALFGGLDEAVRKKGVGEWLGGLRQEGATVPKALQPYITPPAAGAAGGNAAGAGGSPRGPAPGTQAPGAPAGATKEAVRQARDRAQATGNWDEFRRLAGLGAEWGSPPGR